MKGLFKETHAISEARCSKLLVSVLTYAPQARASINSMGLGASYNSGHATVTFRVYTSTATQIMLYVYASPYGAQEVGSYAMSSSSGVWSTTISVSTLQSVGVMGPIYHGYRAWSPNRPYSLDWFKGSSAEFLSGAQNFEAEPSSLIS